MSPAEEAIAAGTMPSDEAFPDLDATADQSHRAADAAAGTRRRRKSSGLGNDMRAAGDSGAPALATSLAHLNGADGGRYHVRADGKEKRFSKRRKARSLARRVKLYAVKHTWVVPLAILAVFGSLYAANPSATNPIHRFIFLSYKLPPRPGADPSAPAQYGKGLWDIALVAFYTVVLSFTREFVMQELLRPLARYAGIRSRGKQARFMEQMYTAVYFGLLGPAGMYVMSRTDVWFFNTRGMYEQYPHKELDGTLKFYYLFQAAYWAQQAIVLLLGMEKPRKDFRELVGHHIVSLSLIALSYRFHFTHIGLAVYVTHDISDFFLATSKSLNYVKAPYPYMELYFFLFACVWIYLRHYLNLRIIWSLFTEFRTVGPYVLDWEGGSYKCDIAFVITLSLLAALQSLNLFWLYCIGRVAYRLVVHNIVEDDRSDNEESEVDGPDAPPPHPPLPNGKAKAAAAAAATAATVAAAVASSTALPNGATNGGAASSQPKRR